MPIVPINLDTLITFCGFIALLVGCGFFFNRARITKALELANQINTTYREALEQAQLTNKNLVEEVHALTLKVAELALKVDQLKDVNAELNIENRALKLAAISTHSGLIMAAQQSPPPPPILTP